MVELGLLTGGSERTRQSTQCWRYTSGLLVALFSWFCLVCYLGFSTRSENDLVLDVSYSNKSPSF